MPFKITITDAYGNLELKNIPVSLLVDNKVVAQCMVNDAGEAIFDTTVKVDEQLYIRADLEQLRKKA